MQRPPSGRVGYQSVTPMGCGFLWRSSSPSEASATLWAAGPAGAQRTSRRRASALELADGVRREQALHRRES